MRLIEKSWSILEPLLPNLRVREDGKGRPWRGNREILEGILWVLKTGARWRDLPRDYPPYQTCHRRFQCWREKGVIDKILSVLAKDLFDLGILDLSESFIDGTFSPAKKGGLFIGKTKKGKGTKIMGVGDSSGLPIGLSIESASPHEITLVEKTIEEIYAPHLPEKLIGDKAYDSDQLDQILEKNYSIELISPHKKNRKIPPTQDGRKLRRFKRRWKIERMFSWIQNFRRLVIRYEVKAENFLAFLKLAGIMILLRVFP